MKHCVFLFLTFLNVCLYAQNLVPNGGFEDLKTFPIFCNHFLSSKSFMGYIHHWKSATDATPDIMTGCKNPHSGNSMAGLIVYQQGMNWREYIQVKLKTPLIVGEMYKFEMYVKLELSSTFQVSSLGVYYSQHKFYENTFYPLSELNPQLKISHVKINTEEWLRVSQEFIAHNNAEYITIGCFNENPTLKKVNPNDLGQGYYFIDDVSITKQNCAENTTICQGDSVLLTSCLVPIIGWADKESPTQIISSHHTLSVTPEKSTTYLIYSEYDTVEVNVNVISLPKVNLGNDTILCHKDYLQFDYNLNNTQYLWQDSSTTNDYVIDKEGIYSLQTNRNGCISNDSIIVNYHPTLVREWARDTIVCYENEFPWMLTAETENINSYLWNDGSQDAILNITNDGEYWIEVTSNNCYFRDTIDVVFEYCNVELVMPNVFTPNEDQTNDVFVPIIYNGILESTLTIYNRLGKEIYQTKDVLSGWEPRKDHSDGVYFWHINFLGNREQKGEQKGYVYIVR